MGSVITTNYNGRLHLGYGDENSISHSLGKSISRYQGPFAQFFANLFRLSVDIQICGKKYCLNKDSFKDHLQSIGFNGTEIEKIKTTGYDTFIQRNDTKLIISNSKLGDTLSHKKRMILFYKMILEMQKNNTESVKKFIKKGAYVDREFYQCGKLWINRSDLNMYLYNCYNEINFKCYTPLAFATSIGNQSMAQFIFNAKGKDISSDKISTVKFAIKGRKHRVDFNGTRFSKTKVIQVQQVTLRDGQFYMLNPPS